MSKRKILGTIGRMLAGGGAGLYGAHNVNEGTFPIVSDQWGGGGIKNEHARKISLLLGGTLGAGMGLKGRNLFMNPARKVKIPIEGAGQIGKGRVRVISPASLSLRKTLTTPMVPLGVANLPHVLDTEVSTLQRAKQYIEEMSQDMGDLINARKTDPAADIMTRKAQKAMTGSAMDVLKSPEGKELATNLVRDFALSGGGGIAGYYGGGALGGALGNLLYPDDERDEYEKRTGKRDNRKFIRSIGKALGAYSSALGAPLLYRHLTRPNSGKK
jgi:hypothetical protein